MFSLAYAAPRWGTHSVDEASVNLDRLPCGRHRAPSDLILFSNGTPLVLGAKLEAPLSCHRNAFIALAKSFVR